MQTTGMDFNSFKINVPPEYEEVFSHFYFAENKTLHSITTTLFPSYQTILAFSLGSKISIISHQNKKLEIDKCIVLGPIKHAFEYTLPIDSEILVCNFKDNAFYRFFGSRVLSEHLPFDPDELMDNNCFTSLWYQLKKLSSVFEKVNFILEFCKPYLRSRSDAFRLLANLSNNSSVLNPIKVVAQETQQSERTVQLKQKKYYGFSAKEINRYQRFLKATELIQNIVLSSGKKMDWFEVIHQCGYYDQSHLIHDFKHFINLSPKQFLEFQQDICFSKPE